MPLGVIDGTGPQASGQRVPVSGVENRGKTLPEVPTELLDTSRTANLYAQVVNRLLPADTTTPLWSPPARKEPSYLAQPPSIQPVRGVQSGIFCRVVILANAP